MALKPEGGYDWDLGPDKAAVEALREKDVARMAEITSNLVKYRADIDVLSKRPDMNMELISEINRKAEVEKQEYDFLLSGLRGEAIESDAQSRNRVAGQNRSMRAADDAAEVVRQGIIESKLANVDTTRYTTLDGKPAGEASVTRNDERNPGLYASVSTQAPSEHEMVDIPPVYARSDDAQRFIDGANADAVRLQEELSGFKLDLDNPEATTEETKE